VPHDLLDTIVMLDKRDNLTFISPPHIRLRSGTTPGVAFQQFKNYKTWAIPAQSRRAVLPPGSGLALGTPRPIATAKR
jgi:hypothetical protein